MTIVERGQRFRGFTPEGLRVLDHTRRILADCDALRQEAGSLRVELAGRLRIGVFPTALPVMAVLTLPGNKVTAVEIRRTNRQSG